MNYDEVCVVVKAVPLHVASNIKVRSDSGPFNLIGFDVLIKKKPTVKKK